jgi:hypothetical protein
LARRVLSAALCSSLFLVLALASCRRENRAPAPSTSASALGNKFTLNARERHFQEELARARARFETKPDLGNCAKALKEKADLELCQAAASALAALTAEPAQAPELMLTRLEPSALTLARLSERTRYLSLAELAQRRMDGDAGALPAPPGSSATAAGSALPAHLQKGERAAHHEQHTLELGDGPVSKLMERSTQLERDVLRNLGAYLEYGPLPVRRAAFDTIKRLCAVHPEWPALDRLLHEAVVLESDAALQLDLRQLSACGPSQGRRAGQSAATK